MNTRETPVEEAAAARILAVDETAIRLLDFALGEDIGSGDWTTRWTVPPRARLECALVARAPGTLAGVALAAAVFRRLSPKVEATLARADGDSVMAGDAIALIRGPGRAILAGERTALGILGRLSGIATLARQYVSALAGTGAAVLGDGGTPGWRALEAAAMRAGGAVPRRVGLGDAAVVRAAHVAVAGSIAEAVRRVRDQNTRALRVEVEASGVQDALEAAAERADVVVLLTADPGFVAGAAEAIGRTNPRPLLCVSCDLPPESVAALVHAGADAVLARRLSSSAPVLAVELEACTR